jgi:hypothetical protein
LLKKEEIDLQAKIDEEEICEKCKKRYLENAEPDLYVTWIGCDYNGCGKWYHSFC